MQKYCNFIISIFFIISNPLTAGKLINWLEPFGRSLLADQLGNFGMAAGFGKLSTKKKLQNLIKKP